LGAEYENLVSKAMTGLPMPFSQTDDKGHFRFFSSIGKDSDALASFSSETNYTIRPGYWRANLDNPVQFNTAIKNIVATGHYIDFPAVNNTGNKNNANVVDDLPSYH
jgi:hypothetical protein